MHEKLKVFPIAEHDYSLYPLTEMIDGIEVELRGVVEVTQDDLARLTRRELRWNANKDGFEEVEESDRLADAFIINENIIAITNWFNQFYDQQILQAQRAERLGQEFICEDTFGVTYTSVQELDLRAFEFQEQIRNYRKVLIERSKN